MTEASLKHKTIGALLWNLLDRTGQQVLLFIVGILVANILSVEDYALMGMLAIFTALATILIDSGFSVALIQRKEVTDIEYNSVFWFNLLTGCLLYGILVGISPLIARFFHQPQLVELSWVVFLAIPLNALSCIQSTLLNKHIQFKALTRSNLLAMSISGFSAFIMALTHCGVWTLAWQPVILAGVKATLLWQQSTWRPQTQFSWTAIQSLFGFASSLLLASLINTGFLHIYSVAIGTLYPIRQLGYYTQGNKMCDMGVSLLYSSIQNATLPIFSCVQDEHERLIRLYRKTIRFTAFVTFPVMLGMMVTADPLIQLLLKEKWWPTTPFLQWLCVGGCFTILTAINNNFIKISGRTDGILKIEYGKIVLTISLLYLTWQHTVLTMVIGLAVTRGLVYWINLYYTAQYTGYTISMQLKDILPYAGIGLCMTAIIYPLRFFITSPLALIITQTIAGGIIYLGVAYLSGSSLLKESITLMGGKFKRHKKTEKYEE